jgi:hypothetical protein
LYKIQLCLKLLMYESYFYFHIQHVCLCRYNV